MPEELIDILHELIDYAGNEAAKVRLHEQLEELRPKQADPEPEPEAPADPDVSYTG